MGDQQRLPVWGRGGVQGSCPIGARRGRDRARRRLITLSRGDNARHKYLLRGRDSNPKVGTSGSCLVQAQGSRGGRGSPFTIMTMRESRPAEAMRLESGECGREGLGSKHETKRLETCFIGSRASCKE